jgi:hypothetical protein
VLVPVDAGCSTGVEPIRREAAVNRTTKSEDKHMKTDKYVGLDVHKVDTQVVIAEDGRNGDAARSAERAEPGAQRRVR